MRVGLWRRATWQKGCLGTGMRATLADRRVRHNLARLPALLPPAATRRLPE